MKKSGVKVHSVLKFSHPATGKHISFSDTVRRAITVLALAILPLLIITTAGPAHPTSRIKDIAAFEGVRDNQLVGYGLVVGLDGTGDSLNNAPFTKQSLEAMLERLGVNTRDANLKTDNVAAVIVTAVLPPFARQGSRIDINVSTLGDSESLQGGTLLVTPLIGADSEVYAVAQGQLTIGGFAAKGKAAKVTKGTPTGARIANGAIVEREVKFRFADLRELKISLHNPDFTTSRRVSQAINNLVSGNPASPIDPATVLLTIPESHKQNLFGLIADIEQLSVNPDQVARVLIDEQTGIIVMGQNVKVDTVAIAQGNLTIRITESEQVSQPNAFAGAGETETVERSEIEIDEGDDKQLAVLNVGVNIQELVDGLNALGIGPRDMISILQSIKAVGALQAEIVVM